MELSSQSVKETTGKMGFDLCGIAAAERFQNASEQRNPAEILPGCRSVIVVAKRFLTGSFISRSTIPYTILRNLLSQHIDLKTIELSYFLEENGFPSVPTGAIEPCNYDNILSKTMGLVSLKDAAYRAGLGVTGKNTLLITPEYGNRIWLGAVLTTADLKPDPVMSYNPCGESCTLCIDNCPVDALDGREFMDQTRCWDYAFGEPEEGGEWRIKCFKCRSICPYSEGFKIKKK
jgi:epoxyqueuosine reductase QueG